MDTQTILNTIMPALLSVVIAASVAGAAYLYQWGIARLPANLRSIITEIAGTTVSAVEQKYSAGSPGGAIKKQEAMKMLADIYEGLHLPLDQVHASAAIEAHVFNLNRFRPAKTTGTQQVK